MKHTQKMIFLSTFLSSLLYGNGNYSATIYNNAECAPISANDKPSVGMQDNRRVDVNIETTVINKVKVPEKTVIKTKAYLDEGGVVWTTSDPLINESHLEIKADILYLESPDSLKFYTYNNYSDYISRYELLIFSKNDQNHLIPLKLIEGKNLPTEIIWKVHKEKQITINSQKNLFYALRVYDKDGHYDETTTKQLFIKESKKKNAYQDIEGEIFGKNAIKTRTIPISGSRVRVYGEGISPNSILKIDEQEIRVGKNGKFVYEKIKNAGKYDIPISIMTGIGTVYEKELSIDVKENHIFLVGLADFTAGAYDVTGNIKPLEADEHYNEDIFVDGRLAFYLKGKIKGKYLITAQMDTQEADIKDMFKNIHKKILVINKDAIYTKMVVCVLIDDVEMILLLRFVIF